MKDLSGKHCAVLGLGIEGLSSAQFLLKKNAHVWILDQNDEKDIDQEILSQAQKLSAEFKFGQDAFENLEEYDFVVRSPGIKLSDLRLEPSKITSQTKLFFDLSPAPIIGVTGTKGKGTTSSLIYEMLKAQRLDVYLGGNIGVPPFGFLERLTPHSWVVLELSSFQLQDVVKSPSYAKASEDKPSAQFGKPHIAIVLMVTSEHLDYHKDVHEYIEAKRNLLRYQTSNDFAIINRDYLASNESDVYTEGKIYKVSRERDTEQGCFVRDGTVIVKKGDKEEEIIKTSDILLPGEHNLENVCAAVMAATLAGVKKEAIVSVLKSFKGLEHRLELVKEVHGVKYYDDSFSTTPETAIAAIMAFTDPEILVLGGSSKNADFTELGKVIADSENIKAIIGVGVEWPKIKEAIEKAQWRTTVPITFLEGAKTMSEIFTRVLEVVEFGDVVLLSPACASFDMFRNYKDRGEQFKKEINQLQQ